MCVTLHETGNQSPTKYLIGNRGGDGRGSRRPALLRVVQHRLYRGIVLPEVGRPRLVALGVVAAHNPLDVEPRGEVLPVKV